MTTLEETRSETSSVGERTLNALDRCDSCGSQAYVLALLGGSELLFCAHHARKHEAKLRPIAELWQDETHRLSA